jgi:hypothetical protein
MKNPLLSGAALAIALNFAAPAVQAADVEFCKEYARGAVSQVRTAAKHRRCEGLLNQEGRWSSNYKAHYEWCREVKRDQVRSERNERKRELEDCSRRR